ncbi:MAG: 50S ribosome-binding GTPase [Candidatus Micrarchaeales archaeon]|nr:50S ribosome-binding GTPase [Candidatus Micrarchaeales archaeon]
MVQDKETLEKKIQELKEEYSRTKENKKTNYHIGLIRMKIAQAKRDLVVASKKIHREGFFVKKMGDATVALVGFPSAGKSSLINVIANTKNKTAAYAFTTTKIIPGTMIHKDSHIQVFDMPGLIEDAHLGKGGGRMVISAAKVADLIVFVIDINQTQQFEKLMKELNSLEIHINKKKPYIQINEQEMGGIRIEVNKSGLPEEDIKEILMGLGIHNALISIWGRVSDDELISIISGRAIYMRAIMALNKIDTNSDYRKIAEDLSKRYNIEVIPISATNQTNTDLLKDKIYENLGIITVYLKHRMEEERMPMVLGKGATVGDAAKKFHTSIIDELNCAMITGPSSKFPNQRVGIAHVLAEGDVITFIKNK